MKKVKEILGLKHEFGFSDRKAEDKSGGITIIVE